MSIVRLVYDPPFFSSPPFLGLLDHLLRTCTLILCLHFLKVSSIKEFRVLNKLLVTRIFGVGNAELGINIPQITRRTLTVLNPFRMNPDLHEDADLSGPIIFYMLFGLCQLLGGKVHFGVILGWTTLASLFLYTIFNLLAGKMAASTSIDVSALLDTVKFPWCFSRHSPSSYQGQWHLTFRKINRSSLRSIHNLLMVQARS